MIAFLLGGVAAIAVATAAAAQEYRSDMTQIGVTSTLHATKSKGANVTVGVLDGKADLNHYDLAGRTVSLNYGNGVYTKYSLHGTHVAGTIGAGINNRGIVGVAPLANIRSYGFFDDTRWVASDLGRAALIDAKANGVSVVNMSYGPTVAGDLFLNGELNLFKGYNNSIVFVRAAGNAASNINFESYGGDASTDLGHILVVGSVDSNNTISYFSNRAGTSCIGPVASCAADDRISNFFIVAPGRFILSDAPNNSLAYLSGTSMASPHVTGAVALLQSYWPHLKADPKGTATILKKSATDLGAAGVDAVYGWGL